MKVIHTDDIHLKADIYSELINDMQAKISEFMDNYPGCITDELNAVHRKLSDARMGSRIYVDEEHFKEWDALLLSADAAMIADKFAGIASGLDMTAEEVRGARLGFEDID